MRRPFALLSALIVLYVLSAATLSRRFPPPSVDEMTFAVCASEFLHGHGLRYSLNDDVFAREGARFAGLSNTVGRPLFGVWLAAATAIAPDGLWPLRLASVALGTLLLIAVFALGRALGGDRAGLAAAVLLLLQPPFWVASCVVNELLLLALWTASAALLILTKAGRSQWGQMAAGALATTAAMIHANAVMVFPGLALLFWFARPGGAEVKKSVGCFAAGAFVGALFVVAVTDLKSYLLYQNQFYLNFARPPLFQRPFLAAWLGGVARWFTEATSFYILGIHLVSSAFKRVLLGLLVASAAALPLVVGRRRENKGEGRASLGLAAGAGAVALAFSLLMPRMETLYFLVFLPFLLPVIASALTSDGGAKARAAQAVVALAFIGALVPSALAVKRFVGTYRSAETVRRDLQSALPQPPARILAPAILWYDFRGSDFRDASALVTSRYFTEGLFKPREWLDGWRPEVIVVDHALRQVLKKWGESDAALGPLLGVPVRRVATVETGYHLHDRLEILAVDWTGAPRLPAPAPSEG